LKRRNGRILGRKKFSEILDSKRKGRLREPRETTKRLDYEKVYNHNLAVGKNIQADRSQVKMPGIQT